MCSRDSKNHRAAKYFDCFRTQLSDGTHFMFGAYMTWIFFNWILAFLMVWAVEWERLSFSNIAFVTATPNQLCVNVTCGAFYCSLRLPEDCEAETHHFALTGGESQTLCYHACQWTVEILTTANWENRSSGLYITTASTQKIPFPILEGGKRIDVGITKYTDRRLSPPEEAWRIETLAGGAGSYLGCGSTFNQELKQGRRCGAYRMFFDGDEVTKDPTPSLVLNMVMLFLILVFITMVHFTLQQLVNWSAFINSVHLINYGPKDE